MKLIQVNIWCGKLGYPLIDFLNEEQPDIVCMQEVSNLPGHAGPLFTTLDEIMAKTNFTHVASAPVFAYRFMKRMYHFGNAIVSNLPFQDTNVIFTKGSYLEDFDITEDDINIRNFQDVSIKIGKKTLHILNHHGHFVGDSKYGNAETLRQMKILADHIGGLYEPTILCGDFNLAPNSPSIALINDRLTNLPIKYGVSNTYSQLHAFNIVCDYIFVSKDIKVQDFKVSEKLVSDHKALILEFEL